MMEDLLCLQWIGFLGEVEGREHRGHSVGYVWKNEKGIWGGGGVDIFGGGGLWMCSCLEAGGGDVFLL